MIWVLGQRRYDTPHAVWAAKWVAEKKPKTVALELPSNFQPVISKYLAGRITSKQLNVGFGKLLGRSLRLNDKLLDQFERGKVSHASLEAVPPEGAFIYVILAAKKVKAKVVAIDTPIEELESEVLGHVRVGQASQKAVLNRAKAAIHSPDRGLITYSELIHAPFHFLEMLIGHQAEENPFDHPTHCKVCELGVKWERFWHAFYAHYTNFLYPIAESKYVSALYYFDRIREKKMVQRISGLGESLVVIHIWHAMAVADGLKKKGLAVEQIP